MSNDAVSLKNNPYGLTNSVKNPPFSTNPTHFFPEDPAAANRYLMSRQENGQHNLSSSPVMLLIVIQMLYA